MEGPRFGAGGEAGADGEIGEDEKAEDEEGGGAHGPAEGGSDHQALEHDGEDHTAERRARGHDAEGKGSVLLEPSPHRGNCRVEDHRGANRRTNTWIAVSEEPIVKGG